MVAIKAYRQFTGLIPANFSTLKIRESLSDFTIDGVTYAKVIRVTYESRDGSIWRASFGGTDLKLTQKLLSRPVISGTVQGFLQEKQTIPAITQPIPRPAIFGKDWSVQGLSLPLSSLYNSVVNTSPRRAALFSSTVFDGDDTITLSPFDDPADDTQFVRGYGGKDVIIGGAGKDRLNGNGDDDQLFGGIGNDALLGEIGADTLQGDSGADSFLYKSVLQSPAGIGRDTITDFDPASGDVINLGSIDANPSTPVDDKFKFIGTEAFSGSATKGQVRFTTIGSDGLLAINVAGGVDPLAPEMEILLKGVTSLPSLEPNPDFLKL